MFKDHQGMNVTVTEVLQDTITDAMDRAAATLEPHVPEEELSEGERQARREKEEREKEEDKDERSAPDAADAADEDAPASGGSTSDEGGGYVSSAGDASYGSDIAMMSEEVEYTENTVIPHYELLISQAEKAGNGPKTMQALRAGLEAARTAVGASREAIAKVSTTNEPVRQAQDESAGEAALDPDYFRGD
ncbi:hypothetical protein [Nocardiopsis sp. L17-MgMaSL7]|uniref:hypothetical protein n=1 Tax=Nocardiopsis sp. L17-MgMaSL7 TaxID=1938893 RepID=UPI000D8B6752|nr:hypothetical protein [Nocardiopsis sp. L17-MgMaSL7]PWV44562.1 hypothetical protein BDW27_12321 [Nocardiopsis sp. L17-MgMaSL7]